jgi:hypothetical protein
VLWNALAPELWRRTTIAVQRALARLVGLDEARLRQVIRVSYAKVAEFQRRGAIHFHAVIRLDAATDCRCPGCLAPPPEPFTARLLEDALRHAVPAVRVPCPPVDGGPDRYARWGEQLDVHNITTDSDQAGELSAEQVAGYIAKYATKATESFGAGLDRRLTDATTWTSSTAARRMWPSSSALLGSWAAAELDRLRLRAWAHMLGFGGHWSTKSRRYSTTFTVLGGPGSPSPSAAGPATACPWTPGAARGRRPGRDRRRLLGLPRRRRLMRPKGERWLAPSSAAARADANSDGSPRSGTTDP